MIPLRHAPGFESVLITEGDRIVMRADGFGPQLKGLIEAACRQFSQNLAGAEYSGTTRLRLIANAGDLIVWKNRRAIAHLHPTHLNGGGLATTWLNPVRPLSSSGTNSAEPTAEGGHQ